MYLKLARKLAIFIKNNSIGNPSSNKFFQQYAVVSPIFFDVFSGWLPVRKTGTFLSHKTNASK